MIKIVGLGPGAPEALTIGAVKTLEESNNLYFRISYQDMTVVCIFTEIFMFWQLHEFFTFSYFDIN